MSANKLKGLIVENGENVEKLANSIGISTGSLYRKISGKTEFTLNEIHAITDHYNLTPDRMIDVFFTQK